MDTKSEILNKAQSGIQRNGYKAVSFREIAKEVGIKSSSLHYHFPTKDDLAFSLLARLREFRQKGFAELENSTLSAEQKLDKYFVIFINLFKDDRKMCLGGILASENEALEEKSRKELQSFFKDHETWLTNLLEEGKKQGIFHFKQDSQILAGLILASVEGALLVSRAFGSEQKLAATLDSLRALLV